MDKQGFDGKLEERLQKYTALEQEVQTKLQALRAMGEENNAWLAQELGLDTGKNQGNVSALEIVLKARKKLIQ